MRKSLCLIPLALLALAACSGGNGGGGGSSAGSSGGVFGSSSGGSSGGGTSSTLSGFVLGLFANDTTETALPVDLTTVALDDSSDDPTAYASLFTPGG